MARSIDEIKSLRAELAQAQAKARAKWEHVEDLYELRWQVVKPETGAKQHIPSTARAKIDVAVDHIITSKPVVEKVRSGSTAAEQGRYDTMEQFGRAVLYHADVDGQSPPFRDAAKNACLFGKFVLKGPLWNFAAWKERPQRKSKESDKRYKERLAQWRRDRLGTFPIVVRSIDPRFVFEAPDGKRVPSFVIECSKRPVYDVRLRYPEFHDPRSRPDDSPMRNVEWLEYWDEDEFVYLADGEEVAREKNPYGFVPYVVGYSGFGREAPYADMELQAVGLLDYIRDDLEAEARLFTAMDIATQFFVQRVLITSDDPEKVRQQMQTGPFPIVHEGQSQSTRFLEPPAPPADLAMLLRFTSESINRATYAEVLEGQRPAGVSSGYQQAILVGQSRLKFGPIVEALNYAGSAIVGNALRLVEAIGEEVAFFGGDPKSAGAVTLRPEEIKGDYVVRVSFEASDPDENDRRIMLGLRMLAQGTISLRTFLEEFARRPSASEELRQMLVEAGLKSAPVQQAVVQMALRQWGVDLSPDSPTPSESDPNRTSPAGRGEPGVPQAEELGLPQTPAMRGAMPGGPASARPGSLEEQELVLRQMQRMGPPGQGGALQSAPEAR